MPAGSPHRVWARPAAWCAVVLAMGGCASNPEVVSGSGRPAEASTPTSTSASASASAFAAFAGDWMGHTRGLTISTSGAGVETVGDGCCDPVIELHFQLVAVVGSHAEHTQATATVTEVHVQPGWYGNGLGTPPRVGQRFTLSREGGTINDQLTQATYCDEVEEQKGTCGA